MLHGVLPALGPAALDPSTLIGSFGLLGLLLVVFAESGLLVGFFLPGDSLLFTAGLLIATGVLDVPLWLAAVGVAVAAVAGDQTGYLIGRRLGPRVFAQPDSRLFRAAHVERASAFFDRFGGRTILLARFVPVVRTFTPVVAGVARMPYRTFVAWNVGGGLLWAAGVLLLGHALGGVALVREHIEVMLVAIVLVSVVPVGVELLRERLGARRRARAAEETAEVAGGPAPRTDDAPDLTPVA